MELLKVFLMSAVPIVEQRGAIPMGIFMYNINPVLVCIVSFFRKSFTSAIYTIAF